MHKVEDAKPSVMCNIDNYVDVAFVLAFASCNRAENANVQNAARVQVRFTLAECFQAFC